MARTPEQIAADDELAVAIEKVLRVNDLIAPGFAVEDYLVLVSAHGFSDETVGRTEYSYIMPGEGGLAWHRALGLMETHAAMMRDEIVRPDPA